MQSDKNAEILSVLSLDARTPVETIAAMVGLTVEEVKAEIGRLESSGIIKRYKTVVDWEKAGSEKVTAFIDVKVTPARDVGFDATAARIARFPEVQSVWLVSGGSDLRVMIESENIRELGRFIAEKLSTIHGVGGTTTNFILRRYKEDQAAFIEVEDDQRLVVSP